MIMPLGLWVVVGWMAFVALTAVVMIVWGFRAGQFKDIEEPKYRMLEDREPQAWPGREPKGGGADA
jgi:cbb3-type cytochrome oxidase maturation protein